MEELFQTQNAKKIKNHKAFTQLCTSYKDV